MNEDGEDEEEHILLEYKDEDEDEDEGEDKDSVKKEVEPPPPPLLSPPPPPPLSPPPSEQLQKLSHEFRKHYFDAWAKELREQRPASTTEHLRAWESSMQHMQQWIRDEFSAQDDMYLAKLGRAEARTQLALRQIIDIQSELKIIRQALNLRQPVTQNNYSSLLISDFPAPEENAFLIVDEDNDTDDADAEEFKETTVVEQKPKNTFKPTRKSSLRQQQQK